MPSTVTSHGTLHCSPAALRAGILHLSLRSDGVSHQALSSVRIGSVSLFPYVHPQPWHTARQTVQFKIFSEEVNCLLVDCFSRLAGSGWHGQTGLGLLVKTQCTEVGTG